MGLRLAGAAGLCAAAFADVAAPPPDRVRRHLVVVTAGVDVLVAVGAGAAGAWFQVKDPNTGLPVPVASLDTNAVTAAANNAVTIAGGNIQIPH